jgi:hypothetical protein
MAGLGLVFGSIRVRGRVRVRISAWARIRARIPILVRKKNTARNGCKVRKKISPRAYVQS